jgi:O-acetyl-ADP-ribose deacetylase (regulator of RNase III)
MSSRIRVVEGDITQLAVDAIVNAANELMLGGGGVDGAIHRAAGPGLVEECRRVPEVRPGVRCPTRHARITGGHRLPARHVIHTVGPVWRGGGAGEDDDLAACYRNSLDLAVQNGIRTIAFPAISTGVFAFPLERATEIAVRTVLEFLDREPSIEQVTFCCFGGDARRVYEQEVARQGGRHVQS